MLRKIAVREHDAVIVAKLLEERGPDPSGRRCSKIKVERLIEGCFVRVGAVGVVGVLAAISRWSASTRSDESSVPRQRSHFCEDFSELVAYAVLLVRGHVGPNQVEPVAIDEVHSNMTKAGVGILSRFVYVWNREAELRREFLRCRLVRGNSQALLDHRGVAISRNNTRTQFMEDNTVI